MPNVISPLTALGAGVLSFLSPCVLPLVPGYLSLISGVSIEELQQQRKLSRAVLVSSLMFILGFTIVFVALGLAATTVGELLAVYKREITLVAGLLIIVFGLHLVGLLRIKALYADKRMHNVGAKSTPIGAFVMGLAFAFGWSPCVGPILSPILGLAANEETVWRGGMLLLFYSAGLGVPFLLTSLALNRFLKFYTKFRQHLHKVEIVAGVFLIAIGILFVYDRGLERFSAYFSFMNEWVTGLETKLFGQ